MASLSIPNSFSNGSPADALQVNANFNAVKSYVESALVQADGSVKATTASLDDAIVTTAKLATGAVTDAKTSLTPTSGVVKVYASTAARDSAITSPTAGMVVYVDSGDASEGLYTYQGTAWRKGPGWNAPWGVISAQTLTTTDSSITPTSKAIFTTPSFTAVANRNYRLTYLDPQISNNMGYNTYAALRLSSASGTILYQNIVTLVINAASISYVTTLTAGATVLVAALNCDNGSTSTATRQATWPAQFIVEDIGPAGAPA